MSPRRPHLLPIALLRTSLPICLLLTGTLLTGCGQSGTEPAPAPAAREERRLPPDLALDTGLVRRWSDMPVSGPGRDVPGIAVDEMCGPGATPWPGPAVDRMAASQSGPEYLTVREAVLYTSADEARTALDRLRSQVEACPSAGDRSYALLEPSDPDTLTFGMHYRSGLGGTVWLVSRRGDVLLALASSGEASAESLRPMAGELTRVQEVVWAAIEPDLP